MVKIYIPSYKRPKTCMTHKLFKDFDVCIVIHEKELKQYQESITDKNVTFLCHTDKEKGNMARVRNFILENNKEEEFIMCDDDIKYFKCMENNKQHMMNSDQLKQMIYNGFIMAKELKTVLWGINLLDDPMAYREYSPLSLLSVVLGPFSAHIKNNLKYDNRLPLKEDYDYALQVLKKHRKILRMNRYSYTTDHITLPGGCASYRTKDKEIQQMEAFKRKWGKRIVKGNIKQSINPNVTIPLKGI